MDYYDPGVKMNDQGCVLRLSLFYGDVIHTSMQWCLGYSQHWATITTKSRIFSLPPKKPHTH